MENMDKGLTVPKKERIGRIPQMPQNLSAQIVCPTPKFSDFDEKRLHWASVVRGQHTVVSSGCGSKEKKLYGKQDHKFSGTFCCFTRCDIFGENLASYSYFVLLKKRIIFCCQKMHTFQGFNTIANAILFATSQPVFFSLLQPK